MCEPSEGYDQPEYPPNLGFLSSHRANNEDTFKNVMILRLILDFAGYISLVQSGNRPVVLIHNAVIIAVITSLSARCLGKDIESLRFQMIPSTYKFHDFKFRSGNWFSFCSNCLKV